MTRTQNPTPPHPSSGAPSGFPFSTLHEVNERCVALLVNAAHSEDRPPFALVAPLRELLCSTGPASRRRAAESGFLLLDMEFQDLEWWRAVRTYPDRQVRNGQWRGQFARRTAIPLTRATLMLVWQSIHADLDTACALLGLARPVAELISDLQLLELEGIAVRRSRHLYPRWHDHPLVWRTLLLAASGEKPPALRNFRIQGLQLITGGLLAEHSGDGGLNGKAEKDD
jgi:hypothetical protein